MKKLINVFSKFDTWSISFEERHPYIAGSICMAALFFGLFAFLIIGHLAGY